MTEEQLEQIRRSLAMAGSLPASTAEQLLADVHRLRALVRSLGGEP